MKMSALESPTLYFPSETLVIGNCDGQEHWPRISRTYKTQYKLIKKDHTICRQL